MGRAMFFPGVLRASVVALLSALTLSAPAAAGLFDDEEARKAILELRQKVEANRVAAEGANQRLGEELRRASDENVQMRRGMLDLQNQIETLRSELHSVRATLEAFNASATIAGADTADACGLGMTDQKPWNLALRVTTTNAVATYLIDRWD